MQQIMKRADAIKRGIHKTEAAAPARIAPAPRRNDVVSIRIDRDPAILAQIKRDVATGIIPF